MPGPGEGPGAAAGEALVVPLSQLADEIEFALAYTLACGAGANLGPDARRKAVCAHMAAVLAERADNGLSGMSIGSE